MKKEQKERLITELYQYFHHRFSVSMTEFEEAIRELGLIRGRLETYFEVKSYEERKLEPVRCRDEKRRGDT